MSLHIIKCKTILKINEIETINLTRYLNFHRHTETAGEAWVAGCSGTSRKALSTVLSGLAMSAGVSSGSKWRSSGGTLACDLGI